MFRNVVQNRMWTLARVRTIPGITFNAAISTRLFSQTIYRSYPAEWTARQTRMLQDQEFTTKAEERVFKKLLKEYDPAALSVQDISGGCGSMYAIHITSKAFNDLKIFKQHQLVNHFLKDDLAQWHGMQLVTKKDER